MSPPTWKAGTSPCRRAGNIHVHPLYRPGPGTLVSSLGQCFRTLAKSQMSPFTVVCLQSLIKGLRWKLQEAKRQQPSGNAIGPFILFPRQDQVAFRD